MSRTFDTSHARFDAILCDVDGCLTPESATPLDVEALARVTEHNRHALAGRDRPTLTLCTGRPQPFAECISRLVGNAGLGALPLIAENGAWLYDPSSNDYVPDPAITSVHRAMVRELASWLDDTFGPRGVTQQPGKSASVSLFHPDPSVLRTIAPIIETECLRRGWSMRISMTWFYINCDLAHISKATGIRRWIERTRLSPARLAGIGDTTSDLAIRASVKWFACPANAAESLKPHADYVAGCAEARGVLEILERISLDVTAE
jgi:hydroxymethylpyrimidine pyrophosphatase-like HAD family hydrolase